MFKKDKDGGWRFFVLELLWAHGILLQLPTALQTKTRNILATENISVFFRQSGLYFVSSILVKPSCLNNKEDDLAVLSLIDIVDGIKSVEVSSRSVNPGENSLFVGFGGVRGFLEDGGGTVMFRSGIQRMGGAIITFCPKDLDNQQFVCLGSISTLNEGPIPCPGDSGGGLFMPTNGGKLVGVNSFGRSEFGRSCAKPKLSVLINLNHHAAWVSSMTYEENECGNFECLSNNDILLSSREYLFPIRSGVVAANAKAQESSRLFNVDAGYQYDFLVVTANAQSNDDDAASGRFHLKISEACESKVSGSVVHCIISEPKGRYSLKITSTEGSASFK